MTPTIENIYKLAKTNVKKIVLAEADDPRVQEAAKIICDQKIADIILVSPEYISENQDLYKKFSQELFVLRQSKGLTLEEAKRVVNSYPDSSRSLIGFTKQFTSEKYYVAKIRFSDNKEKTPKDTTSIMLST